MDRRDKHGDDELREILTVTTDSNESASYESWYQIFGLANDTGIIMLQSNDGAAGRRGRDQAQPLMG